MLTQDGWIEPVEEHVCKECGCEYEVVGVIDIREDVGICWECEKKIIGFE